MHVGRQELARHRRAPHVPPPRHRLRMPLPVAGQAGDVDTSRRGAQHPSRSSPVLTGPDARILRQRALHDRTPRTRGTCSQGKLLPPPTPGVCRRVGGTPPLRACRGAGRVVVVGNIVCGLPWWGAPPAGFGGPTHHGPEPRPGGATVR
jgi:hypothetical protein